MLLLLPHGPSDSSKIVLNELEDAHVPRGCQRTRGPRSPGPRPRLRGREGIPRSAPNLTRTRAKSHEATTLHRSEGQGFQGAALRALSHRARNARRAVRSSAPGAGPAPRARAPSRPRPLIHRPPSPAPAQLCSALTLTA